jgi:integrase
MGTRASAARSSPPLGCAGLRNSEVCDLNLRDLDFTHAVIHVRDATTEADFRQVNMTPWLHDELLAYRASEPTRSSTSPHSPPYRGTP